MVVVGIVADAAGGVGGEAWTCDRQTNGINPKIYSLCPPKTIPPVAERALGRCWWTKKKEKRKMGREAARQKREREKRAGREKIQNIIISTMTRHDDDDNRRHVERHWHRRYALCHF